MRAQRDPIRLADGAHVVTHYRDDGDLEPLVARYLGAALAAGGNVVVIASSARCARLREALRARTGGTDPGARVTMRDAAAVLEGFMVDGAPVPARFEATVGALIAETAADGRPVRAYGEMVDLLWAAGNVTGAARLEDLWNDLATRRPFGLLCAYRTDDGLLEAALAQMCTLHTDTVTTAERPPSEVARGFPRSRTSAAQARRFVADTLGAWHLSELIPDAQLVVTELVANAVLHAASDVVVGIDRTPTGTRLSVTDTSGAFPSVRPLEVHRAGGRGLHLVAAAGSWSSTPIRGGKVVSVELPHRA
jgi:hypothetical protein